MKIIKEEFQLRKFGLGHNEPDLFVRPQFGPVWLYLIWTVVWSLYHVAIVISTSVTNSISDPYSVPVIYLTNWSFYLLTLMILVDSTCVLYSQIGPKHFLQNSINEGNGRYLPWYLKISWLLFVVTTEAAVLVTILYWALLTPKTIFSSVSKHAINSVFAVLHLLYTAKPVQLLHVIYPILYFTIYIIFSVAYQFGSGDIIYSVLDWNNPGKAVMLSLPLIVVGVPILHLLVYLAVLGRIYLRNTMSYAKTEPSQTTEVEA